MPELPELQAVQEVLARRVVGMTIRAVHVFPGSAIVVRDLTHSGFAETLTGATITAIARRGKFLVFSIARDDAPLYLVLNLKLTGRLQLARGGEKRLPKTHLILELASGDELRYVDQRVMGQVYLTRDLAQVPDFASMGPEPFEISRDEFRARLARYRGEIKGILTRGEFVAGIGNAYADEILWAARLHPPACAWRACCCVCATATATGSTRSKARRICSIGGRWRRSFEPTTGLSFWIPPRAKRRCVSTVSLP